MNAAPTSAFDDLYRAIDALPPVACIECGGCCGPVACSREEAGRILAHCREHDITPEVGGIGDCPFHVGGHCAIYAVRPLLCRMMGHSLRLRCPHGAGQAMDCQVEAMFATGLPPLEEAVVLHDLAEELRQTPSDAAGEKG